MKIKTSVEIKCNTKEWDRMKRRVSRVNKAVDVGWWQSMHPTGVPVATVAMLNEEGGINGPTSAFPGAYTPARPFMRTDFDLHVRKNIPEYASYVDNVMRGEISAAQMYRNIKDNLETGLKLSILNFENPPNSPTTISIKGFNDPLIDTGTMYDTIKTRISNT